MLNNTNANNVKYRLKSHLWGSNGVVDSVLTRTNYFSKGLRQNVDVG